jgi:hypothetical protein
MGSRLLPTSLAGAAVLADAGGLHGIAFYLVLLAIPCACGAAFLGLSDALEGRDVLRGVTASLALVLLVLAAAVRANAVGGVPALAASALLGTLVVYGLPLLAWVLEPLRPRPRFRTSP